MEAAAVFFFFSFSTSSHFLLSDAQPASPCHLAPPPPAISLFTTTTTTTAQDPTVHPRWTGDASAVASEDGRLAKFARKFEGGVVPGGGGTAKKEDAKR